MTDLRRVLIVDDDPGVRNVLDRVLQAGPFAVHLVENGHQALERVAGESFDVVVVDKNLPGMGGVDLVQLLRGQDPHIGVILITAFPTLESAKDLLHLGIDAYLTKPFNDVFDVLEKTREAVAARDERSRTSAARKGVTPETGPEIVVVLTDAGEMAWARQELTRYTTRIVSATSSSAGLAAVAASPPALAVIDSEVKEPDLTGMLSRLLVNTPEVAVVVITQSQPPLAFVTRLIDLHASALVERPLTPQAFHDKVRYVLRRSGRSGQVL